MYKGARILQGKGCKHFAVWTMQPFEGSVFFSKVDAETFCRLSTANILQPTGWTVDTTNILKRKYCKYFEDWKFCYRADAANILKGECCKHFAGWTLQTFYRENEANFLQGEHCKLFETHFFELKLHFAG